MGVRYILLATMPTDAGGCLPSSLEALPVPLRGCPPRRTPSGRSTALAEDVAAVAAGTQEELALAAVGSMGVIDFLTFMRKRENMRLECASGSHVTNIGCRSACFVAIRRARTPGGVRRAIACEGRTWLGIFPVDAR
jgi:hypothetical protein